MTRRVYFAFHYQRDIFRVNIVRNCWLTQEREAAGFYDASLWEKSKTKGDEAIKKLILGGLDNTSVTAVLIGNQTANRDWVRYEIIESYNRGNGLLGVYIHNIKSVDGYTDIQGGNPFDHVWLDYPNGTRAYFSSLYPTYDWAWNQGYQTFGDWVEASAKAAGH